MDNSACAVLYLDRRARATGPLTRLALESGEVGHLADAGDEDAAHNISTLLTAFSQVSVFADGISCLAKVAQLDDSRNPSPIVVALDIPNDDEAQNRKVSIDNRSPSPTAMRRTQVEKNEPNDLYGMHLLLFLASEIQQRARSRLVVPVAIIRGKVDLMTESMRVSRYLDAGAVDVLSTPFTVDRVQALAIHAYRRFKEVSREESSFALTKRNRKLSWVGIDEERPYAYLREVMVSGLMDGICNPDTVAESIDPSDLHIDAQTKDEVERAVGTWSFSAHKFNSDALLYAALVMLKHALKIPELEKWKMSTDDLTTFLMACRKAYNDFVLYHNFRHIVDVLQAVFFFLLQIGVLPPYEPEGSSGPAEEASLASPKDQAGATPSTTGFAPLTTLLTPFDGLTLLISAIGHDVGHPGVNNAFLVALNAPLAQLYNDRSVLEAFHCAAYSQILRRYWPEAFSDSGMRKLMINSILATDMGLHFKYMVDMGNLQERINATPTEDWTPKSMEDTRDLCCGLLIKCADISNVARKYDTAAQWAVILTDEFANQGAMEEELNLPTCLFGGPPERGDVIKLAESQVGFMTIFARPLFEAMANLLPAMNFGVTEMLLNQSIWEEKAQTERARRVSVKHKQPDEGAGPLAQATVSLDIDEHHELESGDLPPLPVERDSFIGLPRSSHGEDPVFPSDHFFRLQGEPLSSAERRLRNASLGSSSPNRAAHRKTSGSGSFHGFAHQHSASRRSSKDAALDQLEQMQFNAYSRQGQSFDSGRRGSADASLTTILVRSQTPQNKQGSASNPTSPTKRHPRSLSQPNQAGGDSSLPSSRSDGTNATLATTMPPPSLSTQASSINEGEAGTKEAGGGASAAAGAEMLLKPELHPPEQRQTLSAPDILAIPETGHGKISLLSHITKDGGEEGDDTGRHPNLRQSRSRSRLRGLRFWRKRWKSPGGGVDVEHSE